ncbi:MAG: hypothetical protein K6C12_15615 [Oscillospiraceae bacterium]|nr:hypothetical protein [Oscillospiraceae bacterium]
MPSDLIFNTPAGQTVARELLICYLNTGTAATPVWSPSASVSRRAPPSWTGTAIPSGTSWAAPTEP